MRELSLAVAAAASLLVPAGGAGAQTNPATWVHRVLTEWDAIQRQDGWAPTGEVRPGALAGGAEARLQYPLAAGATYRLVVVCEAGCGAGEVELLDPAGARVGEAKPLVEMPKLDVAPTAAGTYTLRVAMTDCAAAAACAWSARLYTKTAARPRRRK
ncbi:MAG TPA: hypothetical protein VGA98_01400 [Allosphingosinicella sp.]|jgi:hypothetical protein